MADSEQTGAPYNASVEGNRQTDREREGMDFVIVVLSVVAAYMVYHWLEVPTDRRRNSERRWR